MKQLFLNLPAKDLVKSQEFYEALGFIIHPVFTDENQKCLAAGGIEPIPLIDEGFMQVRTIEDPDGYTWGLLYLDMDKFVAKN